MKRKNRLEHDYDLANFLFEKRIPFKYKRTIVQITKIEMILPSRGKVKIELTIDTEKWETAEVITLEDLYKNSLSKIV